MQYRSFATVISSGVIGLASLASAPSLSPQVLPLEESFADAQSVKRSMAYRARSVALESR